MKIPRKACGEFQKEGVFLKIVQFVNSAQERLLKKRVHKVRYSSFNIYSLKYIPIFCVLLLNLNAIFKLILCVAWWFVITIFKDHRTITEFKPVINIWFGVPGSGKTSMAAYLTKQSIKNGYPVLSNVQISGALKLDPDDLGKYDMSFNGYGAHVIYDEGSIDFDNRNFKAFAQSDKPKYFALHRHMNNRVDVFSQAFDIDKRIRDRAGSAGLFHLKKLPIPGFVMYRQIKKVLFINKEDKQLIDGFSYQGLPRIVYTKSVWNSFDTLDLSLCPKLKKEWQPW